MSEDAESLTDGDDKMRVLRDVPGPVQSLVRDPPRGGAHLRLRIPYRHRKTERPGIACE